MKMNADVLRGFHREIALAIGTDVLIRVHWPMKPNMSYTDNQKGFSCHRWSTSLELLFRWRRLLFSFCPLRMIKAQGVIIAWFCALRAGFEFITSQNKTKVADYSNKIKMFSSWLRGVMHNIK